jgi:hypothetical protein
MNEVSGAGSAGQLRRTLGKRTPIRDRQLAQQRGDVRLHGTHRDEQPGPDLGVAEMFSDQREHLGFPRGDVNHCPILS